MTKVMFIDQQGMYEVVEIGSVPRRGDEVCIFDRRDVVSAVVWFPSNVFYDLKQLNVDVLITLS